MRLALNEGRRVDGSPAGMVRDESWREVPRVPFERMLIYQELTGGHLTVIT